MNVSPSQANFDRVRTIGTISVKRVETLLTVRQRLQPLEQASFVESLVALGVVANDARSFLGRDGE